jgi:predicted transcriptional regulator of viral defense system
MAMKNPKTKPLDWAKLLTNEARLTDILAADEIAEKYKLHVTSVWKALSRLEDRGLVSRVSKGIYVNKLVRDNSPLDFVRALRTDSYVSLESALSDSGLSTQTPVTLTCVTLGKPKEYKTSEFTITFRTISEQLFWGFVEKQTRYSTYKIAEPEKALLDWIYLSLQGGLTPELDEIDFKRLDKQRLVKYADKFPNTVRNILVHSLAFEHFAA